MDYLNFLLPGLLPYQLSRPYYGYFLVVIIRVKFVSFHLDLKVFVVTLVGLFYVKGSS